MKKHWERKALARGTSEKAFAGSAVRRARSGLFRQRIAEIEKNEFLRRETGELRKHGFGFLANFPKKTVGKNRRMLLDIGQGEGRFPAEIRLGVTLEGGQMVDRPYTCGMELEFHNGIITIREIQGPSPEFIQSKELIQRMNQELGMPWPRFMLQELERAAKKSGYHTVRISPVEENPHYKKPIATSLLMPRNLQQKVMKRVELLRTRTSQGKKVQLKKSELDVLAGFDGEEIREKVQTADGHPVIENGKISAPAEKLAENFWKKIAYVFGQNEARGWVRATMRNLYGRTAVENKYKREGTFFVKHL